MCRIHPFISPELLRLFSNSKVDRAEDVTSELLERGYLEVEGDDWWKFEVLMAMIAQCGGEADSVRVRIVPANDYITINQDDFRELHASSSSTGVSASTTAAITDRDHGPAGSSSLLCDLEAGPGEVTTTVVVMDRDHPPLYRLYARRVLTYFVTKHRKVVSTISTVLITVGGIVLLPGVAACIGGTMFTSHAVQAAGAIAVAVGKWLKVTVDSAAAHPSLVADQA